LGGLKLGFAKLAYQVEMAGAVKTDPKNPAPWQISIEIISFMILFISFFAFYIQNSPILGKNQIRK